MKYMYPATAAKASTVRENLSACGLSKARVRVMRNGAIRLVIPCRADRDAARDALVLSGACNAAGEPFTKPGTEHSWNGAVEIFVRFLEA